MFTCVNPKLGYLNNQIKRGMCFVHCVEYDVVQVRPPCLNNAAGLEYFFKLQQIQLEKGENNHF